MGEGGLDHAAHAMQEGEDDEDDVHVVGEPEGTVSVAP